MKFVADIFSSFLVSNPITPVTFRYWHYTAKCWFCLPVQRSKKIIFREKVTLLVHVRYTYERAYFRRKWQILANFVKCFFSRVVILSCFSAHLEGVFSAILTTFRDLFATVDAASFAFPFCWEFFSTFAASIQFWILLSTFAQLTY